ncbi:hypothetical protein [Nocardioides sp. Root190]|uniref:hypothetical protein n=1 Tax=Nocardioides sp. Root190 TaxID=1736488 RepID=UPI001F2FE3DE|nr:hypothetical protein [Nocardioides sp. Root190]
MNRRGSGAAGGAWGGAALGGYDGGGAEGGGPIGPDCAGGAVGAVLGAGPDAVLGAGPGAGRITVCSCTGGIGSVSGSRGDPERAASAWRRAKSSSSSGV